jgi:phage-related holin
MKALPLLPRYLFCAFVDSPWWKWLIAFGGAVLNYLLPTPETQKLFYTTFCLCVLDTATGIIAVIRVGEAIESAKLGRFVVKVIGYAVMVAVVGLCSNLPGGKSAQEFLLTVVLGGISITEGISILENLDKMGVPVPLYLSKWLKDRRKQLNTGKYTRKS